MKGPVPPPAMTRRLLTALLENGAGTLTALDDRGTLLVTAGGVRIALSQAQLQGLISSGLLRRNADTVSALPEAPAWLRRHAPAPSDGDQAAHQRQHRIAATRRIDSGNGEQHVQLNLAESPLMRLATRKGADGRPFLAAPEVEAGERLRRDFTLGGLSQKVTMSWDHSVGGSGRCAGGGAKAELMDHAMDARRRIDGALRHVGPELAGLLTDVCCELKGLESVERERRWPPRSAKLVLRIALGLLSRHYGTVAGQGAARSNVRAWSASEALSAAR